MKQMIKNWVQIESLENFVYFDKATGKVKITKPLDNETVNGKSTVIANPELAGTESDLIGLQVGDTKYKISGGTKLYKHDILLTVGISDKHYIIISTDNTPITAYSGGPAAADMKIANIVSAYAYANQLFRVEKFNDSKVIFHVISFTDKEIDNVTYQLPKENSFTFVSDTVTPL